MDAALLGSIFLWAAIAAVLAASVPRFNKPMFGVAGALAGASVVVLGWALIARDFSMEYVVRTTSLATPWPYRLSAIWGGMEGSMLFYAAMTLAVTWFGLRRHKNASAIAAAIGFALLLFTALLANPFEVLDIPAVDGNGLLALLQHPAMIYHPPILYLGLTTLAVPFALTVDGVIRRRIDVSWISLSRRWLLISWTLLTLGMVTGANWAYVELGWGGYWAWDPVENTALMPWLATTVFLHTSRVHEADGRMRRWSVLFASLPFALTVLGVYLTRSGATGSIHAFAENPVIGRILLIAALVAGVGVASLAIRTPKGEPWERFGPGRDTWLAANGVLVTVILIFVTVGSAYPAYAQVFFGESLSVDSTFFVSTIYPVALVITLGIGLAFHTRWRRLGVTAGDLATLGGSALLIGGVAVILAGQRWVPIFLLAIAGASTVLLAKDFASRRPRGRILAGHLAHLGLALVIVGAAGSALGADFAGVMAPGEIIEVGGRRITLARIETGEADRFIYVRASFTVDDSRVLEPEIRAYEDQALPVAEPALLSRPGGDVIIAISKVTADASSVNVSVFVRPMVVWVWLGAVTMALAGLVALASKDEVGGERRREAKAGQLSEEIPIGKSSR